MEHGSDYRTDIGCNLTKPLGKYAFMQRAHAISLISIGSHPSIGAQLIAAVEWIDDPASI
jgi:hypothetical protein